MKSNRSIGVWIVAIIAVAFGFLTLKSGGSVLFIDGVGRQEAGNYVPFVLWFNFLMGFVYIIAGVGLWLQKRWLITYFSTLYKSTPPVFGTFVHVFIGCRQLKYLTSDEITCKDLLL